MALKEYQTFLELNKLYEVKERGGVSGTEQLKPNIYIKGGSVDIYGSNSATEPTGFADMGLTSNDTNVSAVKGLDVLPRYIAIQENTATVSEIVVSGIDVEELADFTP